MALNRIQLKADLKSLFTELKTIDDKDVAMELFTDELSTIIDSYIKTADVLPGIAVTVGGSGGATTGTGQLE